MKIFKQRNLVLLLTRNNHSTVFSCQKSTTIGMYNYMYHYIYVIFAKLHYFLKTKFYHNYMVPVFVIGYHPESNRQFPQGQKTMGVNSFGEEGRNLHDCCWNDQQAEKDGCHGNNHARPGIFYLIKLNTSPLLNLSYHFLYFVIVKAF